jgi:peptidoglycan/LPS O-acetylase OafA/YrhL
MSATISRPQPRPRARRRPAPLVRHGGGFRGDIEGLRAVAVLLVVMFHAGVPLAGGGFVGVDVFFVLSGFLITGLLVDELATTGTISLTDFYARRVRRLLPMSTLVLAATAVAAYLLIPPINRVGVGGDIVSAALWVANWRFAIGSTQYMADADQSPLLHYWSLSVEEQFYVLWPLLLLVLVGRSGVALRNGSVAMRRLALALSLLAAGSFALSWTTSAATGPWAYFGLHTRGWELAVGALLALARPALKSLTPELAGALGWTGLVLVLGAVLVVGESTPFPGVAALMPVAGTALLVAAGARLPGAGASSRLAHPVLRYIGRVSYAWYLWHWPCLVVVNARWPQAPDVASDSATRAAWWAVLAALVLSFGLAVVSHYIVEQPLRRWSFLRMSRRRSLRFGAGLVAMSVLTALALVTASLVSSHREQQLVEERVAATPHASGARAPTVVPMTAEQARKDSPRSPEGCYVGYGDAQPPPAESCRLGAADGSVRLALLGDSHATQWVPAIDAAARARGWTVYFYAKSACPTTDVRTAVNSSLQPYSSCERWRAAVFDRVASIKDLDAVVLGRYMDYRSRVLLSPQERSTAATVGPLWRAGSERSFQRLKASAPRIVVLRDTPRPSGDVPTCLSGNLTDEGQCSFPRTTGTRLDQPLADAEKAALPSVRFVDLTSVLCPDAACPVRAPTGQVIYRDLHHLTASYSASIAGPFGDALAAALR